MRTTTYLRRFIRHPQALRRVVLGLCCVWFAALGLSQAAPMFLPRELPVLRISAGPAGTRRHQVASYLSRAASHDGVLLQLETNAGSEASLEALRAGTLDAAIVSNGVVVPSDDAVMVLGAIQVEAVHILVRAPYTTGRSVAEAVRGRRVNIGVKGSTERLLAHDFLRFGRLRLPTATDPGDLVPTEFSRSELIERASRIRQATGASREALIAALPDCLVVLDATPSSVVQTLVEVADYHLLPIPSTRAYLADTLQDTDVASTVILREFLEPTTIIKNSYVGRDVLPSTDLETLGVRLLLVAREDAPAEAIQPLMKALFEGEFARRIHTKSPRDLASPYAIHPEAIEYLDRNKPLPINDMVEHAEQTFSLFGAFIALALSAYGLVGRKKVRKPSDYFTEIRKIEQMARGGEIDATAPLQPNDLRQYLDGRLQTLRQELIADICEGRIKGDQVITNTLTLLNDARVGLDQSIPRANVPASARAPHGTFARPAHRVA